MGQKIGFGIEIGFGIVIIGRVEYVYITMNWDHRNCGSNVNSLLQLAEFDGPKLFAYEY